MSKERAEKKNILARALYLVSKHFHPHRDDIRLPIFKSEWEDSYLKGTWNRIKQPLELGHYSIIVGYLNYYKYNGRFLDVGCGEGLLFDRICSCSYSGYVGIDISETAIDRASKKQNAKASFFQTALEQYKPKENFDAIVFNEILYYLENPVETVKQYNSYLKEDGIFIISMYGTKPTSKIWKALEETYIPLDETRIFNRQNSSWIIKVFKSSEEKATTQ